MAQSPSEGTYYIINRVLGPNGDRLAITFNGDNQAVTATSFGAQNSKQQWVLTKAGDGVLGALTYYISPVDNQNLQIGQAAGHIITLPTGNYLFNIYKDDFGYLVQDGNRGNTWALENATSGSRVVFPGYLGEKQRWYLHDVSNGVLPS